MGKVTGFMEYDRARYPGYQPVEERIRHWREFQLPMAPSRSCSTQGARCMDCGVPFCHDGCPLGNVIPDFNDLVYQGRWQRALEVLRSTNNFPEFTGRVCPAPCESACVLGINQPAGHHQGHRGRHHRARLRRGLDGAAAAPRSARARSVAVVGSGPAGLAAADQLNRAGHAVTVFERADRIGGLLRYGIPDFKLEKDVLDRRLDLMAGRGRHVPHRRPRRRRLPGGPARGPLRRRRPGWRVHAAARPVHPGPRGTRRRSFAMDFLRQSNRRARGRQHPRRTRRSWPRARTSSSSAAATRAPTAWAPPSGRAPAP